MKFSARIFPILGAAAIVCLNCAPKQQYDAERIDSLRTQAETLIRAQSLMGYGSWVYGLPSNQDSLYRAHASLFTLENIRQVAAAMAAESDTVQKHRLRYLHRYLVTEYLAKQTAPISDRVSNVESAARFTVDGTSYPYRQLGALLSNEPSQERRAALYGAAGPVYDTLNVLLKQALDTDRRSVSELGYRSYVEMAGECKEFPLADLRVTAERVLNETQEQYTALLREILRKEMGLTPERFYRYDTPPLFRSRSYDRFFPRAGLLTTLHATYRGMGIDLDSLRALSIDTAALPAKNPRAVCYAIDVPDDIRLSIKPIGGQDDYKQLFHEMGHALHYAHTRENAFEFKYLGENTLTETYAFLSEYTLENQAWLRMHSGMAVPVLKDYLRLSAFHRLYMIRRYAAKTLYEIELRSGSATPDEAYAALMARAIGTNVLPADRLRYLTDIDAMFYSASYLRAWFLEGQLAAHLAREYGANWFENREAGAYLKSLWARGDRLSGDALAVMLNQGMIAPDDVLREITLMITMSTQAGT